MRKRKALRVVIIGVVIVGIFFGIGILAHNRPIQKEERMKASMNSSSLNKIEGRLDQDEKEQVDVKKSSLPLAQKAKYESTSQTQKQPAIDSTSAGIQQILGLRGYPTEESVALLSRFIESEDPAVLSEAIDALGSIALGNEDLKEQIFFILASKALAPDFPQRGNALVTAAMIGDEEKLLPLIEEFIAEPNEESIALASRALAFVATPKCVPLLNRIVKTAADLKTQKNALAVLFEINTPEAIAVITETLDSPSEETQAAAVWALTRSNDSQNNELLSNAMLEGHLSDESLGVLARSSSASDVFGNALLSDSVTADKKISLLNVLAANTVKSPGSIRSSVAKSLLPLIDSSDPELQKTAIDTLSKVGAKENMAEVLEPTLHSDDFLVQETALYAYAQYTTPETYKPLKELWYNENEKIRRTAFFLASMFVNESDMEDLQEATEHEDKFISKQAGISIKFINQKK